MNTPKGIHLSGRRETNTAPEVLLRRAFHAAGGRFRLHRNLAKGCTPDIVFPGRRLAIFVDGRFWHGCPDHGRKTAWTGPNANLWEGKMRRNQERVARANQLAVQAGWQVGRVWECEIQMDADVVARRILVAADT